MLLCSGAKVCVFNNRKQGQFVAQHQLCGACGCMPASPTCRQASRSTKAHLEGYKMLIDLKAALHQSNLNPERPVPRKMFIWYKNSNSASIGVENLQDQMNEIKIRDDKEVEATIINGKGTKTGHIIVTTTGGKNGVGVSQSN
ncbi:uncharacterized protein [Miscanthus floridulus]|uniref:uncharacterized protein isoform X2 n=1 Tax=Miscanthus floridulus TaxID=154761 RepID=UPI003458D5A9